MGKVIFAGIIGGIIAVAWGFISWMVLPWHAKTIKQFRNEEFVGWVIRDNAPKDGVYMIPHMQPQSKTMSLEEVESKVESIIESKGSKKEVGPVVYVQIKKKGVDMGSPRPYIRSFLIQFLGAALISYIIAQGNILRYGKRLLCFTLFGLAVGVLSALPNWNWMGAPTDYTLVMLGDLVVQWFIMGIFLAGIVRPRASLERMM